MTSPSPFLLPQRPHYLPYRDPILVSIAHVQATAAHITNRNQLSAWVQGPLRTLIPHHKAILGFGQVGYSTLRIDLAHAIGLGEEYFAAANANAQTPVSPVMSKWLQQRAPQTFMPDHFCRTTHGHWHKKVAQHQIENGVLDASVEYAAGRLCCLLVGVMIAISTHRAVRLPHLR